MSLHIASIANASLVTATVFNRMAFKYAAVRKLSCPEVVLVFESDIEREIRKLRMFCDGQAELSVRTLCDFDRARDLWRCQVAEQLHSFNETTEARKLARLMMDEIGRCNLVSYGGNSAVHETFFKAN